MLEGTNLHGRYQIIRQLGRGAFLDTYLVQDRDLPGYPRYVIKHLKPTSSGSATLVIAERLFDREAQVLYQLGQHDQIPRLLAHFLQNGKFYLVEEFIEGHNLSQELTPGKRFEEEEVVKLLQEILEVLAFVHQQNVIHRDIKPQNLIRRRTDGKIVLINFAAVKEIGSLAVNTQDPFSFTIAIGTPGYMPSEQAAGRPKFSSDIYAVGMVGIQALTGLLPQQLPQDPHTGELIWRNYIQVSDKLADVLTKMVCYDFRQRYHSASEALEALNALTYAPSPPPPPPLPTPPTTLPSPSSSFRNSYGRRLHLLYWNVRENIGVFFDSNKSLYHTWQKSKYIIAFACGGAFLGSLAGRTSVSIFGALIGAAYGCISQRNNTAVSKTHFTANEIHCQKSILKRGEHMIALASGGAFLGGLISQAPGSVVGGIIGAILSLITNV